MPEQLENIAAQERRARQRWEGNAGLLSVLAGGGILYLTFPTLLQHWENPPEATMLFTDIVVATPAVGAVLIGGYYVGRAFYRLSQNRQQSYGSKASEISKT